MIMYIGLGVAAVGISILVYFQTQGAKESGGQKVSLDDIEEEQGEDAANSGKSKKKKKGKKSAGATGANMDGPIDKDALYQEIDENGPYVRTI